MVKPIENHGMPLLQEKVVYLEYRLCPCLRMTPDAVFLENYGYSAMRSSQWGAYQLTIETKWSPGLHLLVVPLVVLN